MGNTTSNEVPPPATNPSARPDLQYLIDLGADEKAWVLAVLGNDPLKKARAILSSSKVNKPGSLFTRKELAWAVDDVIKSFGTHTAVDEDYIINLIEGIVERVREEGGINEAMEQVISLAARMIKGEDCQECGSLEYEPPIRGSSDLVDEFVNALARLVQISGEQGMNLVFSTKANFSIAKLATIYDERFWLPIIGDVYMDADEMEVMEEMWCHEKGCSCWDYFCRYDEHSEKFYFTEFVHVYAQK